VAARGEPGLKASDSSIEARIMGGCLSVRAIRVPKRAEDGLLAPKEVIRLYVNDFCAHNGNTGDGCVDFCPSTTRQEDILGTGWKALHRGAGPSFVPWLG
jgi:hypothetical protein